MSSELIIDVSPSHVEIALLEIKKLVELNRENSDIKFAVGDIYLAKVKKIMPGLNAAFVDVGYEKDAFLHYLDLGPQFLTFNKFLQLALQKKQRRIHMQAIENEPDINKNGKIGDILNVGQFVMVQIAKEPISLETPIGEEEDSHLGDFIEDKKIMSPSEATISMDLADQTRKILSTLTPREEKVLRMRFGISDRVGVPVPDENLSVDAVEPEIEEQEIMEEEIPKKTKSSSRKRAAK